MVCPVMLRAAGRVATGLESARRTHQLEELTFVHAAAESGYSAAHLRRLFPPRKTVPRGPLPRKSTRLPLPHGEPDLAAMILRQAGQSSGSSGCESGCALRRPRRGPAVSVDCRERPARNDGPLSRRDACCRGTNDYGSRGWGFESSWAHGTEELSSVYITVGVKVGVHSM